MGLDRFQKDGRFLMLALDHRNSFRRMAGKEASRSSLVQLKKGIIQSLAGEFSGLLIDPEYGLPAYNQLFGDKTAPSFLMPAEKSGYLPEKQEKLTEIFYQVSELKKMGAAGVKLQLHFNYLAKTADQQIKTARKVSESCQELGLPFFLEPVTYQLPDKELDKGKLVVNSLKKIVAADLEVSVYKLEYPETAEGCQQVTGLLKETPWVLLSGGDQFDQFEKELVVAISNGASGFLVGRALWQDVFNKGINREEFFKRTLPSRFRALSEIGRY